MRNSKRIIFLFCVVLLVFLPFEAGEQVSKNKDGFCVITVFIHGTVCFRLSPTSILTWMKNMLRGKRRAGSAYQEYLEISKRNSLHRYQPINDLGLVRIDLDKELVKKDFGYIGLQTARLYKKMYGTVLGENSDRVEFYTFGWSGRLSHKYRLKAANDLFDLLSRERRRLAEQTGMPVKIHLLAHSHGCNVVLNLARVAKRRKQNFVVDRAVLFGCPVQSETESFISSPVFRRIYSVFSKGDHIQRLDFVSTKDHKSRRVFGSDKNRPIKLPDNFIQLNVKLGRCCPFHYELWLWGGKRFPYFLYRKRVPIHPIPLSVFTPVLVDLADKLDWKAVENRVCKLKFDQARSQFWLDDGTNRFVRGIDLSRLKQQAYSVL
jgi:hypothetical protein